MVAEPVRSDRRSTTQRQSLTTRSDYEPFPGAETEPTGSPTGSPAGDPERDSAGELREAPRQHVQSDQLHQKKSEDVDFDGAGYQEVDLADH